MFRHIALTTAFALTFATAANAQCWENVETEMNETQITFGGEDGCTLPANLTLDGSAVALTCYAEDGTPDAAVFSFTELPNGDLRMIGEAGTDILHPCRR